MFVYACEPDENNTAPTIQFIEEDGFVFTDSLLALGQTIKVGINAQKGSSNITLLQYKINSDGVIESVDSGVNTSSLIFEKSITKNSSQQEIWTFFVKDLNGLSDQVSITFTKSDEVFYRDIISITSINLGAQNNDTLESFYSFDEEISYHLADAYNVQESINLLYYFDFLQDEDNVISSPGANIDVSVFNDEEYGLENWQVKNTTRFIKKTGIISIQEFDVSENDSLILNNTFDFSTGKRKCKNLVAGDIYSFVTESNKRGIIKLNNVQGSDEGIIAFDIKMQQTNE